MNVRQVLEIRRRSGDADWVVKLEPPVNQVLPVSRMYLKQLFWGLRRALSSLHHPPARKPGASLSG